MASGYLSSELERLEQENEEMRDVLAMHRPVGHELGHVEEFVVAGAAGTTFCSACAVLGYPEFGFRKGLKVDPDYDRPVTHKHLAAVIDQETEPVGENG